MILFGNSDGIGRKGRPMESWTDYARDDSARLGLSLTWRRRCAANCDRSRMQASSQHSFWITQAREAWRDAIVLLQLT